MSASTWSQDVYIKAYRFAAQAHRWQRVPGTNLPYIMHLSFVAMEILAAVAQERAEPTFSADLAVQCALLHDVLEDTMVRRETVQAEFGEAVAQGVLALTVNKKLPKDEQMTECLGRIRQQGREIRMVKMADRITNLQPPPRHWSKARIRDYHQEAQMIHAALKEASPFLAERMLLKLRTYAAFVV